jgi:thioredoxin-like negative regulator of GroEL
LRDLKKNPLSENEIRQRSLWQAACNQAKAELDNPTTRASWQARFNEQLQHATADTPAKLVKGQRIIYKVNVEKAQDICQALSISSIPTLLFMKPNTQPGLMVGAPAEAELDQAIQDFIK